MGKRSKRLLTKISLILLAVLCLFNISSQSMDVGGQRVEQLKCEYSTLPNGLKYLIIAHPNSPVTHISISIKKHHCTASTRDKNLSRLLEALLKHKLKPENSNPECREFLANPAAHKVTDSGNFITIEFASNGLTSLVPFKLLHSSILSPPTPEIIAKVKEQCFPNPQPDTPETHLSDAQITKEWAATLSFPNCRLTVVTPNKPTNILNFLNRQFHQHHQRLSPRMYPFNATTPYHLVNPPQLLIYPKKVCSLSPSEKSTITLLIPLIDGVITNIMHSLSDVYHLLGYCNLLYTDYLRTRFSNGVRIKSMPLISLETMLAIYMTIEVDSTEELHIPEVLDLIEGFLQAIKAYYRQPDGALYRFYNETILPGSRPDPGILLGALANLASVQMFFIDPADIIKFVFMAEASPMEAYNMDALVDTAMDRNNWHVCGKLNHVHWRQMPGRASATPMVQPIPETTRKAEEVKNIICLSNFTPEQGQTQTPLDNQQSSSHNSSPTPQPKSTTSSSRPNKRPQLAPLRILPDPIEFFPETPSNIPPANPLSNSPPTVYNNRHNEPGLKACFFASSQPAPHAIAIVILNTIEYLNSIQSYIWHLARVLVVLDEIRTSHQPWLERAKVLIETEVSDNGKITVVVRGSNTGINDILDVFFLLYKTHHATAAQEDRAMSKAYNFFMNKAQQSSRPIQKCMFSRIWQIPLYTPAQCYEYILENNTVLGISAVNKASIKIRVENAPVNLFHAIIKTVKKHIKPEPYTKYELISLHEASTHKAPKTKEISAFVGYFHINPNQTIQKSNYQILAYYLLLGCFPPTHLANHSNIQEIEAWVYTQLTNPPHNPSGAPPDYHALSKLNFDPRILNDLVQSVTIFDETIIMDHVLSGQYDSDALISTTIAYQRYVLWMLYKLTPQQFDAYKQQIQNAFTKVNSSSNIFDKTAILFGCDEFWNDLHYQKTFIATLQTITIEELRLFFLNHCQKPHVVIYPESLQSYHPPQPPLLTPFKSSLKRPSSTPFNELDPKQPSKRFNQSSPIPAQH
ncbi:hypothetical protein NEHOM01_1003 [Nematocida homosporus]|uniref:uncharacterized protein n=1 Tax=Nematocida homosporus TaxID=1912981 RepID=UPI002220B1CE|nr:uncharacterized protein NEHOM01_1003 [Nematocida homosporus]KAI5185711.1 hypothetical protein NEHOM01_1003 [Nematocida homosporus]